MNLRNFSALLFVLFCCVRTHTNAQLRIIGGEYIEIERRPHAVAIFVKNNIYNCAGSIVNFKSVLTAAHCVINRNKRKLVVLAGVTDLSAINTGIGQQRKVVDTHIDCDYNQETQFMDIAVVIVDTPFEENRAVKIIPLCHVPLELGSRMQISGWGSLRINSKTTSPLLKTNFVRITDAQRFRERKTNKPLPEYYAETIMFAGRCGQAMSFGDSGAGGVLNVQLCAVAQGACSHSNFPGLYTNVSNPRVREFITRWM